MSKWNYLLLLVFLMPRSHSKENSVRCAFNPLEKYIINTKLSKDYAV